MGEELKNLLSIGAKAAYANGHRQGPGQKEISKRERAPCLFEVIREHSLKSEVELKAYAFSEAAAGRPKLAEICTKYGGKLREYITNAWAVAGAPRALLEAQLTLLEKLERAASTLPCMCKQEWIPGALFILENNHISAAVFTNAVRTALTCGARRGANMALTGVGGCGKSALLEPLQLCFQAMSKPQAGSTFPLLHALSCDIVLWQDYEHCEKTLRYTDLLSFFVGETLAIRVPGAQNTEHRNTAPTFYSGRLPISPSHVKDQSGRLELQKMMDERFQMFAFTVPLPQQLRQTSWVHCGRCCAQFYLQVHAPPHLPQIAPPASSSSSLGRDLVSQLRELACLMEQGVLDAEEFRAAKRRLLA